VGWWRLPAGCGRLYFVVDKHVFKTPLARAILAAYAAGQEDELLEPHVLVSAQGEPLGRIRRGDAVIFYNIRGEREVELTRALTEREFPHFPTEDLDLAFVSMVRYRNDLGVRPAFPPLERLHNTLGEVLSRAGRRVVKITEAEKAVHLAYFLNGKREEPYEGEERIVVPTRKDVATFDEAPQMSAKEVVEAACKVLGRPSADVVVVNLCNVDVVGHFENRAAVVAAVETVDAALGELVECARANGVTSVVTADHGTVERWLYPDGTVDTGHTSSPVPFIVDAEGARLSESGGLKDVAPTILDLMGLERPAEMSGVSLIGGGAPRAKRVLVLILDGWGHSDSDHGNMIRLARTPNFDALWSKRPHSLLEAAGEAVGLPEGSVGNSEAGHLHLGAGRPVLSDRLRIDRSIKDGSFAANEAFLWAIGEAKRRKTALHLMGIVSFYSSHGSIEHLPVYVHAMLGRRGERPQAGAHYVGTIEEECLRLGFARTAGVIGRYWSLDREENWDRIERTYRWLVYGEGIEVPSD